VIHGVQQGTPGASDPGEDARGSGDFPDWPKWNDITHQKMWVDWIRRAYDGGLRVMVALAVNNKTLGDMIAGPGDYATDDKSSADRQIEETKGFVGRHGDFMAIAYSAEDLRRIVGENKMAVILGVEIDKIGNFDINHPPSNGDIDAEIGRLYAEGVRYAFPIHIIDNAFGGTATYDGGDLFNYSNYREDGRWWTLRCADQADNITYRFKAQGFDLLRIAGVAAKIGLDFALRNPPDYPSCPQRNELGLTAQGIYALHQMMQRGMLIDIDHMSQESFNRAIAIAAQTHGGYPLFSGHSQLRINGGSERNPTAQQYSNISKLHGMTGVGSANVDDCAWTTMAIEVLQTMGDTAAVGFGTDTDGLAMGMPPCKNHPPIQYGAALFQSRTGQRTWDYNKDGVAHYGMLTDFLEAVKRNPHGNELVENNLMYGAEYFYQTWKLAEERAR
jgi:microsomal dipeptidase-like Zn-dependent dipeptidase